MAKVISLQGKARGKIGGIVYRVEAGIGMIASEYNPTPHNPRTIAQTNQRSKMNLAGRISAITPYAAIAGLAANKRQARAKFVSNILKAASPNSGDPGSFIDQGEIVLSEGIVVPISGAISNLDSSGKINVTYNISSVAGEIMGGIMVVYAANEGVNPMCVVRKLDAATGSVEISLSELGFDTSAETTIAAYVVPLIDKGEAARVAFDELHFELNGFKADYVRTLVSTGAYAKSKMVDTKIVADE